MAPKQNIGRQLEAALSENERLHEEIRQLKAALAPQSVTPAELKVCDAGQNPRLDLPGF